MHVNINIYHKYSAVLLSLISQIPLPNKIMQMYGHSAVVFGNGPDFRVITLFGGSTSNFINEVISNTTLLFLCEYPAMLASQC